MPVADPRVWSFLSSLVLTLVLTNPVKPPAFIRQSRMKAGGGLAAATGRHITHHPRFSLICNDALSANRFPRARGRGSRDTARAKRLPILSVIQGEEQKNI